MSNRLGFENRWVEYPQQTLDTGDCVSNPFVFPDDDTEVEIVFSLSQSQFTRILSSLLTGADIEYPETSHQVMWDLVKSLECPLDICELVLNCILNNEDIQNAIAEIVRSSGGTATNGNNLRVGTGQDNLLSGLPCDDNSLCGYATDIIDYMHQLATQLFEEIELGTTGIEQLSIFLSALPAMDLLLNVIGVQDLVDFIDYMISEVEQEFNAAWTPTLRDVYRCDLFTMMCGECTLNIDQLTSYFAGRIGKSITWNDFLLEAIADIFGVGGYQGVASVDFVFAIISVIMQSNSSWLGGNLYSLATVIKMSDPSNDCAIICDPCTPPPFAPVIVNACAGGGYGGHNIIDEGGGFWTIESTDRSAFNDNGITMAVAGGQDYQIRNVTFPVGGFPVTQYFKPVVGSCQIGTVPTLQGLQQCGWTWARNTGVHRVRFELLTYP